MTIYKKDWVLNKEAFQKLLEQFDPDPRLAGEAYERVRSILTRFFECRGGPCPLDLADETINRVARRVMDGEDISGGSLYGYFYGVARNVLREDLRKPGSATTPLESLPPHQTPSEDPIGSNRELTARLTLERRLECLEACADQLPPETRQLVVSYYEGEEGEKIRNRKRIAQEWGIPMNNLRMRVHRIRDRLEKCVCACLHHPGGQETELSF